MITLTVPFPPSDNTYYRHVVIGRAARVLISQPGRAYRRQIARVVTAARAAHAFPAERLAVTVVLHAPDRRRRDVKNFDKALSDALTHAGVWSDDSQVDDHRTVRGELRQPPCAVVTIAAIARGQAALVLPERELEGVPF